jgi:hypothetical protein
LWCEISSLTLIDENGLKVFENKVVREIFGPKRDEVTGVWRKLHNEELRDLYPSPNVIISQELWGYKVKEILHLGAREQIRPNAVALL